MSYRTDCCCRLVCRTLKEDVSGRYSFIPFFTLTVLLSDLFTNVTLISFNL